MTIDREMVHAYGVVAGGEPLGRFRPGIADSEVSMLTAGELAAIVSLLPSEQFSPPNWEQNAENLVWLGKVALRHDQVLKDAIAASDVVPLRLPSMYTDLDAVRDVISRNERRLRDALERVRSRVEWAVKIYGAVQHEESGAHDASAPTTGSDYLLERSRELRVKATAKDRLRRQVFEIYERLRRNCVDAVRNAPQATVLTGVEEPMLLNAAYLVRREDQARFLKLVDEATQTADSSRLVVETTGPWPAYNFTGGIERGDRSAPDDP